MRSFATGRTDEADALRETSGSPWGAAWLAPSDDARECHTAVPPSIRMTATNRSKQTKRRRFMNQRKSGVLSGKGSGEDAAE
ncbi:hypothetical protein llg_39740 [Luteolibacter sp. LG18]|nr:hypothetical protein llg_39740 [Luteolibacter sp. LG18]